MALERVASRPMGTEAEGTWGVAPRHAGWRIRTRPDRALAAVAATLLIASSVLSGPSVDADEFQPSGEPPTVSTPSLTVQAGDGSLTETAVAALQPAWETSTEKYHATVTIGAPSLTESLEEVTLCLYQPSVHTDPATDCDPAAYVPDTAEEPDPTTLFLMVWDRSSAATGADGTFSVVGTNDYGETGSISGWNDGSAISLDLSFGFTVSNAMRKASDWVARVEAVDSGARTASAELANVNVAYFEQIVAQRSAVDFGVITRGGTSVQNDLDTGTYTANSRALLTIDSTTAMFVQTPGGPTIELPKVARGFTRSPNAGEVAVDCLGDATFDASGSLVRLDGSGHQTLFSSIARTGEAAANLPDHSCRAAYGGGLDRANFTLESTVTVALSESAPVPSNVAATTSETSRTVTWDAPAGAGSDFTVESYVIEASTDDGTTFSPLRRVTSDDGTEFTGREVTLTGLERDTVYTFRVTANTTVGAGSATGDADPQVPTVPLGLSADAQSGQIVVSWQAPSGDGGSAITGYTVRGYTGASFDTVSTTQTVGTVTSATFSVGSGAGTIAAGTDYRFTVTASNAEGEGAATPQSEIASVEVVEQAFSAGSGRTGSFQTYTVASTGTYNLLIEGAQGGGTYGGRGAIIDADVSLEAGDVLTILVGHRGQSSSSGGSGGGGASAVWVSRDGGANTLVAIAGGGGGVWKASSFRSSADASTSTTANGGYASPNWRVASGGSGGQSGGGTSGTGGAGGGGGVGSGRASGFTDSRNAGRITSTSAAGADGTSDGGFGGGGGANNNGTTYLGGGGGGGYSGGGGSSSAGGAASYGGGGGSYVNPSYEVSSSIVSGGSGNTGAGSVTISG